MKSRYYFSATCSVISGIAQPMENRKHTKHLALPGTYSAADKY